LFSKLAFRAFFFVDVTAVHYYQSLKYGQGTCTIVEDEFVPTNEDKDKNRILKAGVMKDTYVPRLLITPYGRITKLYPTYCMKVLNSKHLPSGDKMKGFTERLYRISMSYGKAKRDWLKITDEDKKRFNKIRNMLLKWRLITRKEGFPQVDFPFEGRDAILLWDARLRMLHDLPNIQREILEYATKKMKGLIEDRQNSLIGILTKILYEKMKEDELKGTLPTIKGIRVFHMNFTFIWDNLRDILEGSYLNNAMTKMHTVDFGDITKNMIGRRLNDVFKGKKRLKRSGTEINVLYRFPVEHVLSLAKKYQIGDYASEESEEKYESPLSMLDDIEPCRYELPYEKVFKIKNSKAFPIEEIMPKKRVDKP